MRIEVIDALRVFEFSQPILRERNRSGFSSNKLSVTQSQTNAIKLIKANQEGCDDLFD